MGNKLLSITVRGNGYAWDFEFMGDPAYIAEWRADGLEISEVVNVIPEWVVNVGLLKPWCFMQDLLGFKNPWGGK